jgi:MATE family multidrug resistance protein
MRNSFHDHVLSSDDEFSPQKDTSGISDIPLFPLNTQDLLKAASILFKSALPTAISQIGGFLTGLVCLRYAGKYGEDSSELAGATLGFTWSNVLCLGIIASINQGFGVYAAQLYGAKKFRELGILLQRNLCVITVCMIPLLFTLYFADVILIEIGLKYEVSINTGIFLKRVMPSLVGLSYFDCIRSYLIAQNHFNIQPIIQGSMAIVHIFWCQLFVDGMEITPVSGVAIAKSITDVSSILLLLLYIKYKNMCSESWIPWQKECLEGWIHHLKQTLTIGANLYIEWISFEISLFIVGGLNDEHVLAAHGVAVTLTAVFFMMPYGNNLSMQAYLGNAVGEGKVNKAQKIAAIGLGMNLVITVFDFFLMLTLLDVIPDFFTNDVLTKEALKVMMLIYAIAHCADTFVNHLTGILRTIGKESEVLLCFCICYPGISVNCEWIFAIVLGFGYKAVWISITSGMYLMLVLMIIKIRKLDWGLEIAKIRNKLNEGKPDEDAKYVEMQEKLL